MKIVIAIPSYKRPTRVDTLKYLPHARVYVAESEFPEYRKNFPQSDIVPVEDRYQGNLCRVRNHILDREKGNAVCLVDDDLQKIGYWEGQKAYHLESERQVMEFLAKYTVLAIDWGVHLWGINVAPDPQNYREYTPFSLSSYIGGPFMVHIDTPFRFDERLPLKEDYDFTLQVLNKDRKVLRVNKYFYVVKQAEQSGGCAMYRNLTREREQFTLLQQKWGEKIVRSERLQNSRSHSSRKVRRFDINPIIHVPISGV